MTWKLHENLFQIIVIIIVVINNLSSVSSWREQTISMLILSFSRFILHSPKLHQFHFYPSDNTTYSKTNRKL